MEIYRLTLSALSGLRCAVPRIYCFEDPESCAKEAKFNVAASEDLLGWVLT